MKLKFKKKKTICRLNHIQIQITCYNFNRSLIIFCFICNNMSNNWNSANKDWSKKPKIKSSNEPTIKSEPCDNKPPQKRPHNYITQEDNSHILLGDIKSESEEARASSRNGPICSSSLNRPALNPYHSLSKRPMLHSEENINRTKIVKNEQIKVETSDLIILGNNESSSSPSSYSASSTQAQINEPSFRRSKSNSVIIDEENSTGPNQSKPPLIEVNSSETGSNNSERNEEISFNDILEVFNEEDNEIYAEDSNDSCENEHRDRHTQHSKNREDIEAENERLNNFLNTARGIY